MLVRPSRKVLFSTIFVSLVLHAFVCRIPVQSALPEENSYQKLNISLMSLAAPTIVQEEKKIKPVEEAVATKKIVEKQPAKVLKNQVTSNSNGSQISTVVPVLDPTDFVQTVAPIYPRRAIDRGIQGKVLVKVKIGASGKAELVKVEDSSGYKSLDNSAVKAVSKWKFNPVAMAKSSENWVLVPVKFMIQ